jgi:hypothetical protein
MAVTIKRFTRASEVTGGISGNSDARSFDYIVELSEPVASASSDEGDALILDHAELNVPTVWDGCRRGPFQLTQLTPRIFKVTANYSRKDPAALREQVAGSVRISYDFSTESITTYLARSQQIFGADAPDHGNYINVGSEDGKVVVDGTDIPRPTQEFSVSMTVNRATLTPLQRATVTYLVGKVNDAPFNGFLAGEVLFRGAQMTVSEDSDSSETQVEYKFGVRANPVLPMTINGITIPATAGDPPVPVVVWGWDYIWTQLAAQEDVAQADVKAGAKGLYVARVFEAGDFDILGLGL